MTTAFSPGDVVRCLSPYDVLLPGEQLIIGLDDAGNAMLEGGHGLDDVFLELVRAGDGPPAPVVPVRITQFAFQQRFTLQELVAIEFAATDNPSASQEQRLLAAALRVERKLLEAAKFIDLTHPATVAGIQQLEAAGLISEGRATQILSTTITAEEAA